MTNEATSMSIVDTTTSTANSAINVTGNNRAVVELDPDHPGFKDQDYRDRRNIIAQIAVEYTPGTPIPDAPYCEEEHGVWQEVWKGLTPAHQKYAYKEYIESMDKLDISKERIPQLNEISKKIKELSGFRLEPAAGLVLPKVFLETLGQGIFLSTQYIRHYATPLYTPEPDVVHELIGHAANLAIPKIAEINRLVGEAAKRTFTEDGIERLGRVYWYTVEFGVLREEGQVKAYGAGLLSSFGELESMKEADIRPFDFEAMQALPYDVTKYQPVLFCADSFDHMYTGLKDFLTNWQE